MDIGLSLYKEIRKEPRFLRISSYNLKTRHDLSPVLNYISKDLRTSSLF
ncbi:unnamed protein product [Brassica oleracea var. botrytis]